ncbi:MAG: hypothetical protein U5K37_08470 [Natrialbaceae archaeon]|nr:hypothetical protein [Natrialbaceae archaeon]
MLVTDRYGAISTAEHPALTRFDSYVVGSTAWGASSPAVSPFTGYFVYASTETTVPVAAQNFPYKQAADDLLNLPTDYKME